jgi:hypothetical protein
VKFHLAKVMFLVLVFARKVGELEELYRARTISESVDSCTFAIGSFGKFNAKTTDCSLISLVKTFKEHCHDKVHQML